MSNQYEDMAKRVVRSYEKIPEPGHPNYTQEDVWDAYLTFFLFAYHLKDWIVDDDELNITRKEMNIFIEGNSNMKLLQVIVTQAKHLKAVHDHIKYQDVHLSWDDGSPRPSPAIGFQERAFLLTENGGCLLTEDGEKIMLDSPKQEIHPHRLALKVLVTWNKFFIEKKLIGGFVINFSNT